MIQLPDSVALPLRADEDGTIRVGKTRVIFDLVVYAFRRGSTPETIIEMYTTLNLADVYLALGYYQQNRDAIDAYIREREVKAEILREEILARHPEMVVMRKRQLARLEAKKKQ
jgi:uncharacterized protein (DUF433 family)